MSTFWPGTKIAKSMNNAFTIWPDRVFAKDVGEAMKNNIMKRGATEHYGIAAPVMPGLSKRAKNQLKSKDAK